MNILVLDGGGSKGLASARFIQQFEQVCGPVGMRFDLICGVSTGAILGALLARGVSGTVASSLYEEMLPKIFEPKGWRFWRGLTTPKYPADPLVSELKHCFGDGTLKDVDTRLMVLAAQLSPRISPKVWKSWDPKDHSAALVDVLRASSAAPTFFAPHTVGEAVYVDGGLCTNEPSMCALAEVVRMSGTVAQHRILTVRCGTISGYPKDKASRMTSPIGWVDDLLGVMFQCGQRVAEYQSHALIGFSSHVVELGIDGPLDRCGGAFADECLGAALEAWKVHAPALQATYSR